jgi:hypothetical protein
MDSTHHCTIATAHHGTVPHADAMADAAADNCAERRPVSSHHMCAVLYRCVRMEIANHGDFSDQH